MAEVVWLGVLLGVGAAVSVGPIFVTIVQEAVSRGFGASLRVILGSATADLILLIPALSASWLIARVADAAWLLSLIGAGYFVYLSIEASRDALRLWHSSGSLLVANGWSFWKGVLGNLTNPLTWTFWLATGTPTMLRAYEAAAWQGLLLFTVVWFVVASGLEALIALAITRSGHAVGARGQAMFSACSALMFATLAGTLLLS